MLHLDDLDVKIIRELGSPSSPQWNVRESYANISKKLGVDEETVRLRVKRAKERGFLPSWRLMVNPRILGRQAVNFELEVDTEERKPKAMAQVKLVDGVTRILDYRGKALMVTLYSEEESVQRKVQLVESICGSAASTVWRSRFPQPGARMKKIDWKIVRAMKDDARMEIQDVAESLGTSSRTVQRRLSSMKDGKAVFLVAAPKVDVIGGQLCCFLVHCPDHAKKREADKEIRSSFGRMGLSDMSSDEHSMFGMPVENLAEADKALEKLRSMDGVENAGMRIIKEVIVVQDWLKDELDRRISAP